MWGAGRHAARQPPALYLCASGNQPPPTSLALPPSTCCSAPDLQAPSPAPAPTPSPLTSCFAEAGLAFVDASNPKALAKASQVWNKLNTAVALAVVWPTSAEQVAAAVKCARSAGVQAVPR